MLLDESNLKSYSSSNSEVSNDYSEISDSHSLENAVSFLRNYLGSGIEI